MNEQPKTEAELIEASKIATCLICMLAEKMKDCPKCRYNVGLEHKPILSHLTILRLGGHNG